MGDLLASTYSFASLFIHPLSSLSAFPWFPLPAPSFFRRAARHAVLYNSLLPHRTVGVISHHLLRLIAALPLVLVVVFLPPPSYSSSTPRPSLDSLEGVGEAVRALCVQGVEGLRDAAC